MVAIEARGLTKSFKELSVLKGINFTVEKGTVFALLGPNGAGKTTTVRILSTLLTADGGSASVNGFDVGRDPDSVRRSIGLTGQYAAVDEYLTARENLVMLGQLYRLSKEDSKRRAAELLKEFDLEEAADRIAKTFSGGMRRRLDLALSLIASPPIIFLDEPTTGLDPRSRRMVWEKVESLVKEGTTVLLTTQYLEEADYLADRIAVIDNGIVIAEGTADELKQKVGGERLELTVAKESDFAKAVSLMEGANVQTDTERRMVSVETGGTTREIAAAIKKMDDANIEIDTLSLHKPSLDDVFLKFTGHGTGAADTEEK